MTRHAAYLIVVIAAFPAAWLFGWPMRGAAIGCGIITAFYLLESFAEMMGDILTTLRQIEQHLSRRSDP